MIKAKGNSNLSSRRQIINHFEIIIYYLIFSYLIYYNFFFYSFSFLYSLELPLINLYNISF